MKEWVKSLCPEIADWQAAFIAEAAYNMVLDEREACAKVCDDWNDAVGVHLAAAIRARGEQ